MRFFRFSIDSTTIRIPNPVHRFLQGGKSFVRTRLCILKDRHDNHSAFHSENTDKNVSCSSYNPCNPVLTTTSNEAITTPIDAMPSPSEVVPSSIEAIMTPIDAIMTLIDAIMTLIDAITTLIDAMTKPIDEHRDPS